ncbi:MAG: KpsF/GutQ family sugar-phosphate isomerase, partial [Thermodesulfobacteriota bacterium]|nr:KpsF/GutQ family sugar-phosphate isomerase [Thermodesulfobacteriota bacterium]
DALRDRIDKEFSMAVDLIYECNGKVVLLGIGKSGLICKKIAATLASTGTPAFFLHPAEGVHGDLGMVTKDDIIICVSNSGETEEIITLIPILRRLGLKLIVMTGKKSSTLAKNGDVILDISVEEEACPWDLVPTASTTVTLVMGDALAVALLKKKDFKRDDFALLHPGGTLGKKLILNVSDLMHTGDEIPLVKKDTLMKFALLEMTSKRLGVTGVCEENGNLAGVITDGDLRRALEKFDQQLINKEACKVMTENPKTINRKELAVKALNIMEHFSITSLFVLDKEMEKRPVGIIHLHDLLKAGVV